MARFGLTEEQIALIIDAIRRIGGIREVAVFGSRAMGNYKPGSDVDLVIKGKNVSVELSLVLNEELPLPYFFDVVHYETLDSDSLIKHIDEFGIQLFAQ